MAWWRWGLNRDEDSYHNTTFNACIGRKLRATHAADGRGNDTPLRHARGVRREAFTIRRSLPAIFSSLIRQNKYPTNRTKCRTRRYTGYQDLTEYNSTPCCQRLDAVLSLLTAGSRKRQIRYMWAYLCCTTPTASWMREHPRVSFTISNWEAAVTSVSPNTATWTKFTAGHTMTLRYTSPSRKAGI